MQELLEGSMLKRGTGMFVAWKERLFLLTSKQIIYFEDGRLGPTKGSMLWQAEGGKGEGGACC